MKFHSGVNISLKLKTLEHTKLWEKSNFRIRIFIALLCLTVVASQKLFNFYTIIGLALYISLLLWLGIKLKTKSNWSFLEVVIPTFVDLVSSLLLIIGFENGTNPFVPLAYLVVLATLTRLPFHQSFYLVFVYSIFTTGYLSFFAIKGGNIFTSLLMLFSLLILQKFINEKEALETIAYTDALTGTYNRRYFHKYIHLFTSLNLIMMMVDINNLKQINDNFGHDCGDRVIKAVANTLKRYSKKNGITIRWGGDEFLVILCHVNEEECKNISDQIKADISQYFINTGKTKIPVTVSIGIAEQIKGETFIDTINRVDKKMYQEKNIIHRQNGAKEFV